MSTSLSSRDLHPRTGARFVFERDPSDGDDAAPRYAVAIYLPGTELTRARLAWVDGTAQVDPEDASTWGAAPEWARAEVIKLARVLHRSPRAHMVRWRGPS